MGQKVNPKVFRIGGLYTWESRWFANKKNYQKILLEDLKLRRQLLKKLKSAGLARVEIERSINSITITLFVARPGMVIGRGGTGIEELKIFVAKSLDVKIGDKTAPKITLNVEPVKEPNLDANLVAINVADQIIKRLPYKRVLAHMAQRVMDSGAKGVRILLSGRIAGAEISRREKIQMGTLPLSTLREKIDFGSFPALTKSGYVGVKVWINRP